MSSLAWCTYPNILPHVMCSLFFKIQFVEVFLWMHYVQQYRICTAVLLDCTVLCVFFLCSWLAVSKSKYMARVDWAALFLFFLKGNIIHVEGSYIKCWNERMLVYVWAFSFEFESKHRLHSRCLFVCNWENRGVSWSLPARCLGSEGWWQKNVGWEKVASRSCSELVTLVWLCTKRPGAVFLVSLTVVALFLFLLPR